MATVRELRQQAKALYDRGNGRKDLKGYSRMSKAQLSSLVGGGSIKKPLGDARARSTANRYGVAKTFAAEKLSQKLGGSDGAKKEQIKKRILKSVAKELKSQEKKLGRKLSIEEKRSAAIKAIKSEASAIRGGQPEQKKRGGKLTDRKFKDPETNRLFAEAQKISDDYDKKGRKLKKDIQQFRQSVDGHDRDLGDFRAELGEHTAGAKDEIKPFKRKSKLTKKDGITPFVSGTPHESSVHDISKAERERKRLFFASGEAQGKSKEQSEAEWTRGKLQHQQLVDPKAKQAMRLAAKSESRALKHRSAIRDLKQQLAATKKRGDKAKLRAEIKKHTTHAERHRERAAQLLDRAHELGYRTPGQIFKARDDRKAADNDD